MAGTSPGAWAPRQPAPDHHSLPPQVPVPRIPGYRDLVLHRRGSSAEVYRATMERLDRTVAIKLLRLDELTTYQQFQQEMETAMRLSVQPYVVRILDTGTVDGRPYLAMEFCRDGSYAEIVANHGPLSITDAVDVGTKIAEALHAAHQAGIIHRDVTPGNILRSAFGPALSDFGIARRPGELSGTVTLNKLTPHHAAPEALLRQPQSVRSDIYSLGSTLWHLLVGHPPYAQHGERNPDPFVYRDLALHRPVPLLPRHDVPVWLRTEIARAMAKQPEDRHPDAATFGDALRRGWEAWKGRAWLPPASYPPLPATTGAPGSPGADHPRGPGHPQSPDHPQSTGHPQGPGHPQSPGHAQGPHPRGPHLHSPGTGHLGSAAAAHRASSQVTGDPPDPAAGAGPGTGLGAPAASGPGHGDGSGIGPVVTPYRPAPAEPPPAAAEPGQAGRHRRGPFALGTLAGRLVAGVVGVVLGIGLIVALQWLPDGEDRPAGRDSAAPPTARAKVSTDKAPTKVTIDDQGSTVTLSWTDNTGGTAPHYVVGGPQGATPRAMTQVEKGIHEVTIDALNPDTDYCFTVIAVLSVDEVAPSTETCTERG